MDREYEERLRPVGRLLREELNRCGEHVPASAMVDAEEGTVWKKNPSGTYLDITVNRKRVLYTLESYRNSIESTRQKCRESRKNRF